jgi:hypothetical protein
MVRGSVQWKKTLNRNSDTFFRHGFFVLDNKKLPETIRDMLSGNKQQQTGDSLLDSIISQSQKDAEAKQEMLS